jgi:6-phosphogluconolactonase
MATYLYLALAGDHKIAIYGLDPASGRLTFQRDIPLSGAVGPLAVDPQHRFMYAGLRSTCQMASLRFDPGTGNLSLLHTIPLPSDPCFIATDRSGRFLFSAYYGAGAVAVHAISPEGRLGQAPLQWLETAPNAHAIQTDPSNRFAFVPHIAGPNLILQFTFDQERGTLTPNATPRVVPPGRVGPRHFCFHPSLDVAYFVNEQGCSVTTYHFDRSTGTLAPFQTLSTLPEGFGAENTCAQIHISPGGSFLYASNRGHDSIAGFAIDPASGRLRALGQQATEPVPRAFNLDPDGDFLFASGLVSGQLASYRIDRASGALRLLARYRVGERPMWVLAVRLAR